MNLSNLIKKLDVLPGNKSELTAVVAMAFVLASLLGYDVPPDKQVIITKGLVSLFGLFMAFRLNRLVEAVKQNGNGHTSTTETLRVGDVERTVVKPAPPRS